MTDFLAFTVVGIVTGCIYAVAASGLVVTYTTSGIFNFAHGAVGMFMAFLVWELHVNRGWPLVPTLLIVLFVLAPLMGALIERVLMRRLYGSPVRVTLVVTLALLVILLTLAQEIWKPQARNLQPFFNGHSVKIFRVVVTYHELTTLAVAAAIAVFLRLLLFHTRIGVTMRAVVDDRELSGLNGVYPERVAQLSWALGATLAAIAGVLIAPTITLAHLPLTLLVVNGYAAAILGRLRSLPFTFLGALILGLIEAYAIGYGSSFKLLGEMKPALPTIFLFVILVFLPQAKLRAGRVAGPRTPAVPSLRSSIVAGAALVAGAAVLASSVSEYWQYYIGASLVIGVVMLSLVLLTGYAGQVSLMQMAFVGVGALTMGRLAHNGSIYGVLLAGLLAGVLGALVALPALRLQSLYLALSTVALALFAQWAFDQPWLFDRGGILAVPRLKLPGLAIRSEEGQVVLAAVAFSLIAILVLAIRRGPYGRRLAAMSDSEVACGTLGMNLVAGKTTVFALSAAIAGIAGALFGGLRTSVSAPDFYMLQSLFVFLIATIGGMTTASGALFGGIFFALLPEIQRRLGIENLQYVFIGVAAIFLANDPNGFGGNVSLLGEQLRARWRTRAATDVRPLPEVAS